jgi:hypothetical protein
VAVFKNPAGDKNPPLEFVSSVSPNKRPDLSTEKGRQEIQGLVDTYGNIFVQAVARNRGIDADEVVSKFGAGGLRIGAQAIAAGMAEEVSSFEASLAALAEQTQPVAPARPIRRAAQMSLADRIRAMLDAPEETVEAKAPTEVPVTATTQPPAPQASTTPPPQDETARLRAELAAQGQENARLRLDGFKIAGSAWFAQIVGEMRAFPAEETALVAQYVQAALDDHQYGMPADGTSRVALLKQVVGTRTSVKHLTAEALAPTTLAAIMNQSKPAGDPDAPMSPERRAQLHGHSQVGLQVLAEEKKNGTSH